MAPATATAIALSSSPSRSPIVVTRNHKSTAAMSSSPGLPSPSQLFSSMPYQLPTGSRAAPIPNHTVAGFASASSLLRQTRREDQAESGPTAQRLGLPDRLGMQSRNYATVKPNKAKVGDDKENIPTFKKPKALIVEEPISVDKNVIVEKVPSVTTSSKVPEASARKKSRKSKSKEEGGGQTKIQKTRITKPMTSDKGKCAGKVPKKPKAKLAETFNTSLPSQEEDARAREEFKDLCLKKAVPLRRDWTPCRDTVQSPVHGTPSNITNSVPDSDTAISTLTPDARFAHLLGDFGLAKDEGPPLPRPSVPRQESSEALLKKRKIELINGASAPPIAEKPKRIKSPKKKPQTITEKATAPFLMADGTAASPILQYLSPPVQPVALMDGHVNDSNGQVTISKQSAKRAPKKSAAISKVKKQKQPLLLSPETAMRNAGDQELLFGTSSQLVREESPATVRNIQQDVEESAISSQDWGLPVLPVGKFRTSNSLALARPRNLWSVASRDFDGSLLDAETVDLTGTPKPPKHQIDCAPPPVGHVMTEIQLHNEETANHQSMLKWKPDATSLNLEVTSILEQQAHDPNPMIARSVAEATLRKRPSNRSPVKNATNSKSDPNQMPNYQGFTDVQLSKEVAAYGFKKSVKKRVAMITLLEQCWEAKVSLTIQEAQANLQPSQPTNVDAGARTSKPGSPGKKREKSSKNIAASTSVLSNDNGLPAKKARGRPRKDATGNTTPPKRKRKALPKSDAKSERTGVIADEIYDSSPPTPSPPRRRSSPKSPDQLKITNSTTSTKNNDISAYRQDQALLFEQVTKAITTFPPTHDPQNSTFYEKILMFEPVVLEDLTAWLNTEGLAKVGEDDEVWPELVKEWCEKRSVCCLWRENLRGGTRARY